jgi:hypothetical protein
MTTSSPCEQYGVMAVPSSPKRVCKNTDKCTVATEKNIADELPEDIIRTALFNCFEARDRLSFAQTSKCLLAFLAVWRQDAATPLGLLIGSFPNKWTLYTARIIYRIEFDHTHISGHVSFHGQPYYMSSLSYDCLLKQKRIPDIPDAATFYRLAREKAYRHMVSTIENCPKTLTPDNIYAYGGTIHCHLDGLYSVGFSYEYEFGDFFTNHSFYGTEDDRRRYPYKSIAQYFLS